MCSLYTKETLYAIDGNLTVYAVWEIGIYTITFDPNGGILEDNEKSLPYDSELGTLPTPERTGYTFNGWWTSRDGGTQISSTTRVADSDATYYAHWSVNKYTVTCEDYFIDASGNRQTLIHSATAQKDYGTTVYGSDWGSDTELSAIHPYYKYVSCTSATVTTSGATVCRYFHGYNIIKVRDPNGNDSIDGSVAKFSISYNGGEYLTNQLYGAQAYTVLPYGATVRIKDISSPQAYYEVNNVTWNGSAITPSSGVYTATYTDVGKTLYINMKYKALTITLDNQGASTAGTTSIYEKYATGYYLESSATNKMTTTANGITVPSKTGYAFGGYYTSTGGNGTQYIGSNGKLTSSASTTNFSTNGTLYAKWTANVLTVKIYANGATKNSSGATVNELLSTETLNYDGTVGYNWPTDYQDPWGFKLVRYGYDAEGKYHVGSATASKTIGQDLVKETTSVQRIAELLGVLSNLQQGNTEVGLYAGWTLHNYSISYTLNGGSVSTANPTSYNLNTSTFTLSNPTRTGYTFAGWTENQDSIKMIDDFSMPYTFNNTTTGNTLSSVKIQLYSNAGSYITQFGSTSTVGHYLGQYTHTSDTGTYKIRFATNGNKADYTAGWFNVYLTKNTVYNFEWDVTSFSGTKIIVDNLRFYKSGGSNTSIPIKTVKLGSYGNKSYTANWTANTYTVTLNNQSATTAGTTSVTATYGSAMPSITAPTKTGYTFGGYYTSTGGGGTQYYNASGTSVKNWDKTAATTLYAKWTANTYTITLDRNGGTGGTASVTATYDSAMPSATMPSRTGYTFAGYYDAKSGGTQYYTAAGASARTWNKTAATTLYARWTANTYTITLDRNGGTGGTASVTATYDSAMPSATMPSRTGYIFAGYYDAKSGGTQYYTAAGASARAWNKTAATTLYARWTENTYTIAFNKNGGSGTMSNLTGVKYTESKTLTANAFTRTNYTFVGWNTKSDWSGTNYSDKASVSKLSATNGATVTLYAKWAIAKIDSTYYATVQAAINAAGSGKTVVLLGNATESVSVASGKNITLDLNNKTLSYSGQVMNNAGTLTVKNGRITDSSSRTSGVAFYSSGTLTVNSVTVTSPVNCICVTAGSTTLNSSTLNATTAGTAFLINGGSGRANSCTLNSKQWSVYKRAAGGRTILVNCSWNAEITSESSSSSRMYVSAYNYSSSGGTIRIWDSSGTAGWFTITSGPLSAYYGTGGSLTYKDPSGPGTNGVYTATYSVSELTGDPNRKCGAQILLDGAWYEGSTSYGIDIGI